MQLQLVCDCKPVKNIKMSIWVRKDIFVSDISPQNGQNIQEKDGLDEGYLNPEARKVETPAKKLQDSSLEDFKRQMQEFIAKMNADTAAMEHKNVKRNAETSVSSIEQKKEDSIASQEKREAGVEEMENEPRAKRHCPEETSEKLSNQMKDAVKTVCQVCQEEVFFDSMRGHTRREHEMGISEYKLTFGELANNLVEAVYHKCQLCSQKFLLSADAIAKHARMHRMSHREFSARFIVLRGAKAPTKAEIVESKEMEREETCRVEKKEETVTRELASTDKLAEVSLEEKLLERKKTRKEINEEKKKTRIVTSESSRSRINRMSSEELFKEMGRMNRMLASAR